MEDEDYLEIINHLFVELRRVGLSHLVADEQSEPALGQPEGAEPLSPEQRVLVTLERFERQMNVSNRQLVERSLEALSQRLGREVEFAIVEGVPGIRREGEISLQSAPDFTEALAQVRALIRDLRNEPDNAPRNRGGFSP